MEESRQWVATCIAFVDQTRIDESVEEEEYGNSFLSDTLELIDHYYELFCSLESGLDQPAVKQLSFPSMLEKYRVSESVAMRHLRDYLVLRDCLKALGETSRNFRVLKRRMAMASNSPWVQSELAAKLGVAVEFYKNYLLFKKNDFRIGVLKGYGPRYVTSYSSDWSVRLLRGILVRYILYTAHNLIRLRGLSEYWCR